MVLGDPQANQKSKANKAIPKPSPQIIKLEKAILENFIDIDPSSKHNDLKTGTDKCIAALQVQETTQTLFYIRELEKIRAKLSITSKKNAIVERSIAMAKLNKATLLAPLFQTKLSNLNWEDIQGLIFSSGKLNKALEKLPDQAEKSAKAAYLKKKTEEFKQAIIQENYDFTTKAFNSFIKPFTMNAENINPIRGRINKLTENECEQMLPKFKDDITQLHSNAFKQIHDYLPMFADKIKATYLQPQDVLKIRKFIQDVTERSQDLKNFPLNEIVDVIDLLEKGVKDRHTIQEEIVEIGKRMDAIHNEQIKILQDHGFLKRTT